MCGVAAPRTGDFWHRHEVLRKEVKKGFWVGALTCTRNASWCFLRDWGLSKTAFLAEEQGRVGTEERSPYVCPRLLSWPWSLCGTQQGLGSVPGCQGHEQEWSCVPCTAGQAGQAFQMSPKEEPWPEYVKAELLGLHLSDKALAAAK